MPRYDNFGALDSVFVDEADTYFQKVNARLRPDQLQPGELAESVNGRMDVDGAWQLRKGIDVLGDNIASSSEALIIPFYLYATVNITSADRVDDVVTVTTSTNHSFTTATQVGIAGLTGSVNPNGNRTITVTAPDEFTFTITGATGNETYGGTGTAGAGFLSGDINACYGSCGFSDPSNQNSGYIIQALNNTARAIALSDGSDTDIAYPAGVTITENVEMIQAFGKVFIFRNGETALEWNGDLSGSPAFAKVANGTYTQPVVYTASNNTAATGGVVTVTEASHGRSVGDIVTIIDNGTTTLTEGGQYTVATVPGSGSFTFYANVDDFTSTSVVLGVSQSQGRGYTHMPAPPWGIYHQRRLIVPFFYTTTGSSGSEVIADRAIRDEILFSDVLDGDTYDQLQNSFKVTAGIADYTQTVHPFTDDNAVAFNRNSIHLISGLSGSLSDITIKEITREAGLVARNSVVTIGNKIFFLSDNGVYATEFGDLYNLRGAGLPLSDPINPIIKRINSSYAHLATAIFHDNRYWLAVPLDSATVNNHILVYNVLNGGWESLDSVNSNGWDVSKFISGGDGINKLYAVNRFGGVHILDSREDNLDRVYLLAGAAAQTVQISGYATSRQFTMNSSERKKFNNFALHVESSASNQSDGVISVETENIDSETDLGTIFGYLGGFLPVSEDAEIRGRIGNIRAYGLQVTFTPTQGRPKLRMIKLSSSPTFRATTQVT